MKNITVGIPKSLFYWKKPYFWETFFENLGAKVVLSPKTNKEIIERGLRVADPETCFASKVFFGHIMWLDEQNLDYIFVPRLKKNELGLEFCPRFFGLPDLIPLFVKTKVLSPKIDLKKESLEKTLRKLGKEIVGNNNGLIRKATEKSLQKEKEIKEKNEKEFFNKIALKKRKIVLISHPYNLYDDYANLGMENKLEKLGVEVIFIDKIPFHQSSNNSISDVSFHWEFGQEMIAQIKRILNEDISGAIEVSSFQCGCDAVLKEFIEKEFRLRKIPFLYILIDEHTSDAGLQTRIEAFVDTLKK
jgi:predicted nucleotide-binding protein (sugar kinase/HSP70/actin superfamily)